MKMERFGVPPTAVRHGSSAALVLVGVFAMYHWVLAPHLGCLHAMQKLESAVERVAQEKERIDGTLAEKVGQRQTLQREVMELEEGVFTADQAGALVRGLLPLVEQTGCAVVMADFAGKGKPERIEDPNEPVALEVCHPILDAEGQSEQVSALLRQLAAHRPRIWVDACHVTFLNENSGRVACHLALTYYVVTSRKEAAGG
jgi:hypothetical protein